MTRLRTARLAPAAQERGTGAYRLGLHVQNDQIAVQHAFFRDGWLAHATSGQGFEPRGRYCAVQRSVSSGQHDGRVSPKVSFHHFAGFRVD